MRPRMRIEVLATLAALTPVAVPALEADMAEMIRGDDRARLERMDETLGRTLREALALADAGDTDVLVQGFRGTPLPWDQAAQILPGDWSCRMLKLGRSLPLAVYQPFRCRIGPDGRFDKLTGSQRMTGTIGLLDGRITYLGTGFIAGDDPLPYDQLPKVIEPTALPQRVPQAGLVEVTGPTSARILLPLPVLESDLDLLLLSR